MKLPLFLAVVLLPSAAFADEPRELSYGVAANGFQSLLDKQIKRKFAPVDLVVYRLTPANARVAGIWEKREAGDVQIKYGQTRDAIKQAVTDFGNKGYRLERLTGTGAGGPERYTAIWNKIPGQQVTIRYGFPAKALLKEHAKHTDNMYVIHQVMAVEIDNAIRFTAVWDNDEIGERDLELGVSESRLKRDLRSRAKDGFRLRQLVAYFERRRVRYACIWDKSKGPKQEVKLRMSAVTLKKTHEEMTAKGFRPTQLHAYGINRRDRFVGVWEAKKK